ncbi:MAG: GNAT family N-acetyltransferase [Anaerolineae bacterium]
MEIEILTSRDAGSIVQLYRRCFGPQHLKRTIMGCHGAAPYISALMEFAPLQRDHLFIGRRRHGELVGFAHCRALESEWHLNYIAVHPDSTGQGVGTALMGQFASFGERRGFTCLSLRVDSRNSRVVDWYKRLGFQISNSTYRGECDRPFDELDDEMRDSSQIIDWPTAQACRQCMASRLFGFRATLTFGACGASASGGLCSVVRQRRAY